MKKLKVTFVAFGQEHLSISLLSAIAKNEGHEVSLAYSASLFNDRFMPESGVLSRIFNDSGNIISTLQREKPDVVAFSALSSSYRQLLEVAVFCKKNIPDVITVFGGVHPSAAPENVFSEDAVDYIVIGEGEEAFKEILNHIAVADFTTPIHNTWFKNSDKQIVKGSQLPFIENLNSLPQFDKSLWKPYINLGTLYSTMASRGCPYNCSFCYNNHFRHIPGQGGGKYVRMRSPEHLMEELIFAKKEYNIQYVDFVDDIFTMDKKWLKEFLTRYKKEIGKPFHCFVHASFFDEETARLLSDGGCRWVQIGIQSLNEEYKKNNLHRRETNIELSEALRIMKKFRLRSKFDYILGLPGEPIDSQEIAEDFFRFNTPSMLETYWTSFFPATEMTETAYLLGLIDSDTYNNIYQAHTPDVYNKPNIKTDEKTTALLINYRFLFKCFTVMPLFIRKRAGLGFAKIFPTTLKNILYSLISLALSIRYKEPRIKSLIYHIFSQMSRIIKMKYFSFNKK